jgi:hypothetical protein
MTEYTPIHIPFSVYTAWQGYAWSRIPDGISSEEMDIMYRRIGEWRPSYMSPGDSYEGVFYFNGLLAAFKMQCVQRWDAARRDVDYCAFAFMGYDVMKKFDFEFLLGLDVFSIPTRTPGRSIEYCGPTSSPYSIADAMKLRDSCKSDHVDFHCIGDMLDTCGMYCPEWIFGRTSFDGVRSAFAKTGKWTGEPVEWKANRARKKAKLQRISFEDIMKSIGGVR